MKKTFTSFIICFIVINCFGQDIKYATLKGKILNKNSDTIYIKDINHSLKKIHVEQNGFFKDTLFVKKEGMYFLFDGKEYASINLKNSYDLNIEFDGKKFDETIRFKGIGAPENNYFVKYTLIDEKYYDEKLFELNEIDFDALLEVRKKEELKLLEDGELNADFVNSKKQWLELSTKLLKINYIKKRDPSVKIKK